jgi:hypothetical protein
MAIELGWKAGTAPPFGTDVISATFTEEVETIDISNRSNVGSGAVGQRAYKTGFKATTWEIECHDATGLVAALESNTATNGYIVTSVTENISIDGAVTFTVTAREGGL